MRLFNRATESVPSQPATEPAPQAGRYDSPRSAWWDVSSPRALEALLDCSDFGTIKADYYWELGGERAIMWAVTPCTLHTQRYYPEEWVCLLAAAAAAGLDLRCRDDWEKLPRCYGH